MSRPTRGRRSERAAAIVESAITLPVFLFVIFATLEFGLAFRSYLTLTNTTREAARFATTLGRDVDADFQLVYGIRGSMTEVRNATVEQIIVFEASGPTSTTASGALNACRSGSVAGLCNSYTGAALTTAPSGWACGTTSPDRFWCPNTRKVALSDPPDYVGIYIRVRHQGLTGAIGMTKTFEDEVVMRMEATSS